METKKLFFLFSILLSMVGTRASAYDIAVENADGVTIYYNYINDGKELEVVTVYDNTGHIFYSGDVVIPEEVTYMNRTLKVTSIGDKAFYNCSGLTSVTIGNNVTSIGYAAFVFCSGLTSVTIGNSVTSIGDSAFGGCSGLTSVTIPNSVTSIGDHAFQECSGLTSVTISNSVTSIGDYAFYYCSGLTSITIPNSVTSIGNFAFENCSSLTLVNYLCSPTSIGYNIFDHCDNIKEALFDCNTIPSSILSGKKLLQKVTIKESVTSIGNGAFQGCSGLTSVTIPNSVTSIGNVAFHECSGLASVTIPNSVTSIGISAFRGCSGLTSVTIPNSVTSIGISAFNDLDLPEVISKIENPFEIEGKSSKYKTFSLNTFNNATLYVPVGTIDKYKATVGWKDFAVIKEGNGSDNTNSVAQVRANPVLIQSKGYVLTISGAPEGEEITVYNLSGQKVGSARAMSDITVVFTSLQAGDVGIVKIGSNAVKVTMK